MSQTLSQKLGLRNAQPYVASVQRQQAAARAAADAAEVRAEQRKAVIDSLHDLRDGLKSLWRIAAPWVAAFCIVLAVCYQQIADGTAAQLAAVAAERDALRAANSPGASLTLSAARIPDLANAARQMANALDQDVITATGQPNSKRVAP